MEINSIVAYDYRNSREGEGLMTEHGVGGISLNEYPTPAGRRYQITVGRSTGLKSIDEFDALDLVCLRRAINAALRAAQESSVVEPPGSPLDAGRKEVAS